MTTRLTPSERTRRRLSWWWIPAAVATALQLWGIYRAAPPPVEPAIPAFDKIAHLLVFALPVLFVSLAVDRTVHTARRPVAVVAPVALAFVAHAVLSEIVQGAFYTRRTGDPFDVLADLIGVVLGAAAALAVLGRRR